MEDKELEELLKLDIPNIEGNKDKVLEACKARNVENNKKLTRRIYYIPSFVVLFIITILSIVLLSNRESIDISKINKAIDNLEYIDNDEEKMIAIMNIEKDIQNVSADKQEKINIDKLMYANNITVNNLKNSVEWDELFVFDEQYRNVESIVDLRNESVAKIIINGLMPTKAYEERINDIKFNKSFFSLVDIPYSEINILEEDDNVLLNMFRKASKAGDYRHPFYVMYDIQDNTNIEFMIHQSGYIVIRVQKVLEDEITICKKYVSIVRVNYEDFEILFDKDNLKRYNSYKNYNILLNVLIMEKLDNCSIYSLSIIENSSSSIFKIIKDENDINLIMSYINNENVLFDKEIFYVNPYDLACITIGIALELSDGSIDHIVFKVSNEGVLKVKASNDLYIYYTDKNTIDYNALLACIENFLHK